MKKSEEQAINDIRNDKLYMTIFENIYSKYKKYGKITGTFKIKAQSHSDKNILSAFDRNVYNTGEAKIKCRQVEQVFSRAYSIDSFIELIAKVLEVEVLTNEQKKHQEQQKLEHFFSNIINRLDEGIGREWLINLKQKSDFGYNSIIRSYNQIVSRALQSDLLPEKLLRGEIEVLSNEIIQVATCVNNMPCLSGKVENLSMFAARITKNPHFLDSNTFTGKLFLKAILYYTNALEDIRDNQLDNEETDATKYYNLYYNVGIVRDIISNSTTVANLEAYDKDKNIIKAINEFNKWQEPIQLSIRNLLKIDSLKAKNNEIFIFENPSVFNEILLEFKDKISIVCTSGQLNSSAYMILDKIQDLKTIYYAGDFDPEGLNIANNVGARYVNVKYMLYEEKYYKKSKSHQTIREERLSKLEKVNNQQLTEIKNLVIQEKNAAYQEMLVEDYVTYIKTRNQS